MQNEPQRRAVVSIFGSAGDEAEKSEQCVVLFRGSLNKLDLNIK